MPTILNVPFPEKDAAKALGARWDGANRAWFIPDGVDQTPFARWIKPAAAAPAPRAEVPASTSSTAGAEPQHLTLSAYLAGAEQVVKQYLCTPTWIIADVAKADVRGPHLYLDLAEVDGAGQVVAQTRANAFGCTSRTWFKAFVDAVGGPPASGMKILLQVTGSFNVRYGFSLNIHAIDASYTVGEFARKIQNIVRTLHAEALLGLQSRLAQPADYTRIALVAPKEAAGLGDFMADASRLERAGLLSVATFNATFQGEGADASLTAALQAVQAEHVLNPFDACIVLRGGGSAIDLDGCNAINACRAICTMSVPVYSAIGHERDRVALDEVAARSFDTPSKAIGFIRSTIIERAKSAMRALDAVASIAQRRLHVLTARTEGAYGLVAPRARAAITKPATNAAGRYAQIVRVSQIRFDTASRAVAERHSRANRFAAERVQALGAKPTAALTAAVTVANTRMANLAARTDKTARQIASMGQAQIHAAGMRAQSLWTQAGTRAQRRASTLERSVSTLSHTVELADPTRIINRGFAIVLGPNGKPITSAAGLAGDVTIRLRDGERTATIS